MLWREEQLISNEGSSTAPPNQVLHNCNLKAWCSPADWLCNNCDVCSFRHTYPETGYSAAFRSQSLRRAGGIVQQLEGQLLGEAPVSAALLLMPAASR